MSWKLNDTSPIIGQPAEIKLPLKKYQLSALYRCLTIEQSNREFGFMADSAGFGKTGVMISLIVADKKINGKTQNLIVVPQNIITQWINEVEKFSGDFLSVKCLTEYSDITELMFEPDLLTEHDILITTVTQYNSIIDIINQEGLTINRIIYDEIDTMDDIIKKIEERKKQEEKLENINTQNEKRTQQTVRRLYRKTPPKGLKNKITWFVSASLYNSLDEKEGFNFMGKNIPLNDLGKMIVKCEQQFIEKYSFLLEPPKKIIYKCNSLIDIYEDLLSVKQLDAVNSLSFCNIYSKYTDKVSTCDKDILKNTIEDYSLGFKESVKTLEYLNKFKRKTAKLEEDILKNTNDNNFFNKMIESFHSVKCSNTYCDKIKCINDTIDRLDSENTNLKIDILKSICEKIKNDGKNSKILIFSDHQESFKLVENILQELDISFTELSKGNVKEIVEAIDNYKNKDLTYEKNVDVLMIDSSNHGAGMNLENTDILIFLHRTDETLYDQVIGRAQRPGRVGQLKIINLYNNNEII
jgi:hypothetical protein